MKYIEKPYEKFEALGPSALSESELLAIILRTGTKDKNALVLASEVLSLGKYPREGLLGLYDVSLDELSNISGIGPVKAIKLKSIAELSMRMHRLCAKQGFIVDCPETVANYFMEDMRHLSSETVIVACIDSKGLLVSQAKISDGAIDRSLVSPRSVFLEVLKTRANSFILLHNHPSGDPKPSDDDINVTNILEELGEMLEIRLIDHIIIGDNCFYSFRENYWI